MRLFVDTSAFIALHDRSDGRHIRAKTFYDTLTAADRLFTSNYVVDETITRLRYTIGRAAAVSFGEAILTGRLYEVVYVDADLEAEALRVLKRYKDKDLSFTDCTTVSFLAQRGLDAVFAFDEDFSRVGLRTLP